MPTKKTKSKRTKISQKVIQKVIVKIGEMKKEKKARRRARRRVMEEQPLQIQAAVPANVIYQTGYGAFQPPPAAPSISQGITIQEGRKIGEKPKMEWQDVGVGTEGIVEILEKPSKRETLDMLGDVVNINEFPPNANFVSPIIEHATEPINSRIFTEQVLPSERVVGNYRFGEEQKESSMSAPTDLIDNNAASAAAAAVAPKKKKKGKKGGLIIEDDSSEEMGELATASAAATEFFYKEQKIGKPSSKMIKQIQDVFSFDRGNATLFFYDQRRLGKTPKQISQFLESRKKGI